MSPPSPLYILRELCKLTGARRVPIGFVIGDLCPIIRQRRHIRSKGTQRRQPRVHLNALRVRRIQCALGWRELEECTRTSASTHEHRRTHKPAGEGMGGDRIGGGRLLVSSPLDPSTPPATPCSRPSLRCASQSCGSERSAYQVVHCSGRLSARAVLCSGSHPRHLWRAFVGWSQPAHMTMAIGVSVTCPLAPAHE